MSEEKLDLVSREQALRVARMLGCQGVHETEKGWMPCGSYEEYEAIKKGKEEYLKVLASKKKKPLPKMVQRTKRLETKSDAYYENRADALSISKIRGCGGVRTVMLAGKRYYTPCDHKPRKGWEKLDEKPITGIATLPGGGLVTGSFSGKSVEDDIEEKGFVNFVSRSTDPDTFSDPESARIRSRNLGCIGIRRYTARDGKLVWMPCTNVSDYNRVTGIRGDNSPRNNPRRQGAGFKKKTLGDPIGGSVASSGNKPIDGDGDGFIASTPGGVDDTRVSPKQEKRPKGEITKGNIDLNNRPVVKNRDGSISTVRSITITEGNTAVVIPTVIKRPNGSGVIVNDQEAIKYYQRSGQHLGKFSNIRDADTYAQNLHNQQAVQYPNSGKSLGTPIGVKPSEENVDGDGDGFTTGGIVGGQDKIPVKPKLLSNIKLDETDGMNGLEQLFQLVANNKDLDGDELDEDSIKKFKSTEGYDELYKITDKGRAIIQKLISERNSKTSGDEKKSINQKIQKVKQETRKEFAETIQKKFYQLIADKENEVFVQIGHNALESLLRLGKFLNIADADALDPIGGDKGNQTKKRAELEEKKFGINPNSNDRPIYGYLWKGKDGATRKSGETSWEIFDPRASIFNYGSFAIRLKSEVKKRTTVTVGDSYALSDELSPTSLISPHVSGAGINGAWVLRAKDVSDVNGQFAPPYVETQIHNELTLDDIEEIVVQKELYTKIDESLLTNDEMQIDEGDISLEDYQQQQRIVSLLAKSGIKVRIV